MPEFVDRGTSEDSCRYRSYNPADYLCAFHLVDLYFYVHEANLLRRHSIRRNLWRTSP
jgi:hypothetical protein